MPGIELTAYRELKRIAEADPSVAQSILRVPWLVSDIGQLEFEAILFVSLMATYDPAIAAKVVGFSWFRDNVSQDEALGLQHVGRLSTISTEVTLALLNIPWLADGVSQSEVGAIEGIVSLANQEYPEQEFPLSWHVLGLRWVADGLSELEGEKLKILTYIPLALIDQEKRLYQKAEFEPLDAILSLDPENDFLDEGVFLALQEMNPIDLYMRRWDISAYAPSAHLGEQPWFRDGLNDDEKALITSFRSILRSDVTSEAPRILKQLIENGRVHSQTISTPSSGELDIYVVSRSLIPTGEDIFAKLRSQASSAGNSVGDPSLNALIVVLVDPELRTCFPKTQIGAVIDEQASGAQGILAELNDELEEFRSDLTASIQTVYPGEIFEEYGAVPVEDALAPLGDSLQWVALYDNVTHRWVVFDPSGTFTVESLPQPAMVPVPHWSTVGELTHLIPSLIYWVNVDREQTVELGGVNRSLVKGINPVFW